MATRKRAPRTGARQVNASAQEFVQAVAAVAAKEIRDSAPTREEFRELQRTVRKLQKALQARGPSGRPKRAGRPRSNRKCVVAGCSRPHVARGFCSRHYQAKRREDQVAAARKVRKRKARKR